MDFSQYRQVFGLGVIRAKLDWQLLLEHHRSNPVTVSERIVLSHHELAGIHTVWFANAVGDPVDYHTLGAVGLRVGEATRLVDRGGPAETAIRRRERVYELRRQLATEPGPVVLALPAYRLGHDEVLLLDGSHRVVAAALGGISLRVVLFVLEGPADPLVLPDLRRNGGPGHSADS